MTDETSGVIQTNRHERVRYRYGLETGDVFKEDDDFDGTALTIECASWEEAEAILAAIRKPEAEVAALRDKAALIREAFASGYARGMDHTDGEAFDAAEVRAWEDEAPIFNPSAPVSVGMLERAYLAGLNASGEGWNGEYPYQDNGASPTTDAKWIETRDAALRALSEGEGD